MLSITRPIFQQQISQSVLTKSNGYSHGYSVTPNTNIANAKANPNSNPNTTNKQIISHQNKQIIPATNNQIVLQTQANTNGKSTSTNNVNNANNSINSKTNSNTNTKILQYTPLIQNIKEILSYSNSPNSNKLTQQQLLKNAVQLISHVIELHPQQSELYEERIRCYEKISPGTIEINQAVINDYEVLIKIYQNDPQLWYMILQKARHVHAREALSRKQTKNNTNVDANITNIADADAKMNNINNINNAKQNDENMKQNHNDDTKQTNELLRTYNQGIQAFETFAQKNNNFQNLNSALNHFPNNKRDLILSAYHNRASIFRRNKLQEMELADLNRLIQIYQLCSAQFLAEKIPVIPVPDSVLHAYFNRAYIYKQRLQYDSAIHDLALLVQLKSTSTLLKLMQECIVEKLASLENNASKSSEKQNNVNKNIAIHENKSDQTDNVISNTVITPISPADFPITINAVDVVIDANINTTNNTIPNIDDNSSPNMIIVDAISALNSIGEDDITANSNSIFSPNIDTIPDLLIAAQQVQHQSLDIGSKTLCMVQKPNAKRARSEPNQRNNSKAQKID